MKLDPVLWVEFFKRKNNEQQPGETPACVDLHKDEQITLSDVSQGTILMMGCYRPSGYNRCFWSIAFA
ncbi:hypothetical protein [Methylobacterium gnaphalii]|nr:hypothetical protein [Methylobacterium gnaphalii]GJD71319.1 hypothetical protein MMMDOFMJ_4275 [Methylobacterium gnaphalii]GLS48826.1 hypothetical protein GCM10007885_16720 [Methylobacterium gnaphalii]